MVHSGLSPCLRGVGAASGATVVQITVEDKWCALDREAPGLGPRRC